MKDKIISVFVSAIMILIIWGMAIALFGIESRCCNPYDMEQYKCKETVNVTDDG